MRRLLLMCLTLLPLSSCEKDRFNEGSRTISVDITTDIVQAPKGEVALFRLLEGHQVADIHCIKGGSMEKSVWYLEYDDKFSSKDYPSEIDELMQRENDSRAVFFWYDMRYGDRFYPEVPGTYLIAVKLIIDNTNVFTYKEIYITEDMHHTELKVELTDFSPEGRNLYIDGDWTIDYH